MRTRSYNALDTATYRQLAREAEKTLDWVKSASFYRLAAKHYPSRFVQTEHGKKDIAALLAKANNCDAMQQRYEDDCRRWEEKNANFVDGFDRDDLGESVDY